VSVNAVEISCLATPAAAEQPHEDTADYPASQACVPTQIQDFLQYLRTYRNVSPLTLDAYGRDLAKLQQFLAARQVEDDVRRVDTRTIQAFAVSMSGLSPATICRALNATSSFFSHLVRAGLVDRNPVDGVLRPKKQRSLPNIPSLAECRSLIRAAADERERAMLLLLMGAGLRRAELLDLRLSDISVDLRQLGVCGKGEKQRLVFLPDDAAAAVKQYLNTRQETSAWLFVNKAGQRIGNTTFCRLFKRILRRAGLADRGLTPHRLRHFYATQLLRSAVDVKTVQELLGHADLSTTSMYLHTDDNAKMAAAAALPSFSVSVVRQPGEAPTHG
jgi:site-specific recombinase XerD